MSRKRRREAAVEGVLIVDKPSGMSSYDVIRALKPRLGTGKLGHTGTLDPMATGVLVVCAGWATRLIPFLSEGTKGYAGTIRLGVTTDTDDADGAEVRADGLGDVDDAAIASVAHRFCGELSQLPPAYSAAKVDGVRAYAAAREGAPLELEPRIVHVERFELGPLVGDTVAFEAVVSGGTYIRSLARDLGAALGCGGHLTELRRTQNSGFTLEDAIRLDDVEGPEALRSLDAALSFLPSVTLGGPEVVRMGNGQTIPVESALTPGTLVRVRSEGTPGALIAIGRMDSGYASAVVRPVRVRPTGA